MTRTVDFGDDHHEFSSDELIFIRRRLDPNN